MSTPVLKDGLQRKEIHLTDETIKALEARAKEYGCKLKPYMEQILKKDAKKVKPQPTTSTPM